MNLSARRVVLLLSSVLVLGWSHAARAEENHPLPPTVAEGAKLETEYEAAGATLEGPVWDRKTNKLYFTWFGPKATRIMRLDERGKATTWLEHADPKNRVGINGTCLGKDGRLLGAAAYGHFIASYGIGPNGPTDTKILYKNDKLHQPNDVCQAPNGNIYFTDPDFARSKTSAVYLLTPDGKAKAVVHDRQITNGVRTTPDGKLLIVSDDGPENWYAYPIQPDGTVGPGYLFFDPPTAQKGPPDGLGFDEHGNMYASGRGGVWACDKSGKSLGFIPIPEFCSYASFGGEDGKTLFFTTQAGGGKPSHVYSIKMKVRGDQWAEKK